MNCCTRLGPPTYFLFVPAVAEDGRTYTLRLTREAWGRLQADALIEALVLWMQERIDEGETLWLG